MTRDDINRLIQDNRLFHGTVSIGVIMDITHLERFAALVAAAEREACAKVCEDAISSIWEFHPEYVNQVGKNVCTNLAAAIRARGETK